MGNKFPTISVIVTTYDSPSVLRAVLQALAEQDVAVLEVIVADDGSGDETRELIESLKPLMNYSLKHVWQQHSDFRAAMIRNKSAAIASGDYLVFLDGDSVPAVSFIRMHQKLAEDGYFVAGNRILLSSDFTKQVLQQGISLQRWNVWYWFYAFCRGWVNRFLPALPLGSLYPQYLFCNRWQGVRTCNLGVWKKDFFHVNGFDESYTGWGYEDSDFAVRLMRSGILHKDGRFALPIFHLWHPTNSRSREPINYQKLQEAICSSHIQTERGVAQYISG